MQSTQGNKQKNEFIFEHFLNVVLISKKVNDLTVEQKFAFSFDDFQLKSIQKKQTHNSKKKKNSEKYSIEFNDLLV